MKTKKEVFADNIGQISFVGGMVRFDYVSLQPDVEGAEANQVVKRVVMPLAGFLNAFGAMQQLVNKLLEAGVLKAQPAEIPAEKPAKKPAKKTTRKSKKAAPQSENLL